MTLESKKYPGLTHEQKRQLLDLLSGFSDSMTVGGIKTALTPEPPKTLLSKEALDKTLESISYEFVGEVERLSINIRDLSAIKKNLESKWPGFSVKEADAGLIIEDKNGNALMTVLENGMLNHPSRDYFILASDSKGFNYPVRKVFTPAILKRRKEKGKFGEEFEVVQKGSLKTG